jgi:hypothetical protein
MAYNVRRAVASWQSGHPLGTVVKISTNPAESKPGETPAGDERT